jgi:hypothetical protein
MRGRRRSGSSGGGGGGGWSGWLGGVRGRREASGGGGRRRAEVGAVGLGGTEGKTPFWGASCRCGMVRRRWWRGGGRAGGRRNGGEEARRNGAGVLGRDKLRASCFTSFFSFPEIAGIQSLISFFF